MLHMLMTRENGLDSAGHLRKVESTRRSYLLGLSKFQDFQSIHTASINSVDLDPVENKYLLSGASDGVIVIHDIHNITGDHCVTYPSVCSVGRSNPDRHNFSVETVQWYPLDTGMFISSSMDKSVKVWDTNTLKAVSVVPFSSCVYNHHMSAIATRHCLVANACQNNNIYLLDLKSGSATHTLRGHKKAVLTVRWSPRDEFLLATGSKDSQILLWDVRSAKSSLITLDQHNGDTVAGSHSVNTAHNGFVNGLCFLDDGLHLISIGSDENMHLWETTTGRNALVNYGKVENESKKCVAITTSGNHTPTLAFVPSCSEIEVYDVFSGDNISTLRGHFNQVNCCLFNAAYQELYSAAKDRNILVWVPETESVRLYDEHVRETREREERRTGGNFLRRVGARDAWSSDEDD